MAEETRAAAVTARQGRRAPAGGRGRVRSAVLWDAVLARVASEGPRDVVDVGGGTGGFAVPLAERGHRVTVVDANPDALAALERRAAEAGVVVRAVQGDAVDLPGLLGPATADLVLCHNVLEFVDDPAAAMAALTAALRPGGTLSVLAAGRLGGVLSRALGGHFADARAALADPSGRYGAQDRMPRRFTRESLAELAAGAGLRDVALQGVRIFADLVPSGLTDGDAESAEALLALEAAAAVHPVLRDLAAQLHLLADRP
ncbi:Malonyl-[acyl-carrier protein] O-methyltransferase [Actinomadura rubteroloni]|uniref:Malonyl-[acyl-carrier protein] O-methyltransferase n=1 Tax=Actinomadura rubteroloni TaxID=1926885 RepID=A0A2P4UG20_9ACTN|nr:methyltransferase domain-containing protein [Actinomadura rubteroloni]POM24005.1 Malonyl-[acyl-carrier protein] O-methyltransferase [Actinomadura rubteroloni]